MNDEPSHSEATVTFDSRVCPVIAVQKAAYKYIARFATDITVNDAAIVCRLTFTPPVIASDANRLIAELKKEVLDQSLREELARKTEGVRNLILAHAFSDTGLIK